MSLLSDLGTALADIAPYLATTIGGAAGGPVGAALARSAVGVVAGQLQIETTGEPERDAQTLTDALKTASPQEIGALRKADYEFRKEMRALDIEEVRTYADDRDSARRRQVEMGDFWLPSGLAVFVIVAYVGLIVLVAFHELPASASDVVNLLLGGLSVMVTQIAAYYWGSSRGSKDKTFELTALLGRRDK